MVEGARGLAICSIGPSELPLTWPQVSPHIARATALTNGEYEVDDVLTCLTNGMFQLIVVYDEERRIIAGCVMMLRIYPRMSVLEVVFLGGNRGLEWGGEMLEVIEEVGRRAGCSKVSFKGRQEWGRVLGPSGYVPTAVCYEKSLCSTPGRLNGSS